MSQPQNPEVKTAKLTGTETAVAFSKSHPCCWVINLGDSDLYASARPGIVPDADGVYLIPAGGRERITPESDNTIYVYGTGKAMIRGENDLDCPSFRRVGKGGDGSAGSSILPHSEGLTAYFDYSENASGTGWTDIVGGLEINADMIKNDDSVTFLSDGAIDLDLSNAFTIYVICKYIGSSDDWWALVTEEGAAPRFNLASYNHNLGIKTGKSTMDIVKPYSASDYHICTMVFLNGAGILYIDGVYVYYDGNFKTSITNNYTLGKRCSFKMAAFYENVAQSSALIADNVNYLAQKYGIEI